MASGITVTEECKLSYDEMKLRHKYSYIIFKIASDHKTIEVEAKGEKDESFDSFSEKLRQANKKGEGRYAVYDCQYDSAKGNKLVFMMCLCDNSLKIKEKMMYSSSKKALMDVLQCERDLQINDLDELTWESVVEKCQSKYD